ncbi:MAG: FAD-dependent oxidoreductase [Woeseiaceae bacterium]
MTDSVLIVGGGVAGLAAAQHIAASGAHAIVVEREPVVGGRLAAPMTKSQAIGNRADGETIPLFEALAANDSIEIITNATLESIDGRAGNFTTSIRKRARFVTDACTRCKLCHGVCPVVLPNAFDAGLTFRKAIYTPMLTTLPEAWVIDIENCLNTPPNYLPCNRCVDVCDDDAIHFDEALESVEERQVGAIIMAPGMTTGNGEAFTELGYGAHPDIVTSAELQRLLESPGPTGGYASKPSDEEYPDRIMLVLDEPSPFALYIAASQAQQLVEQDIEQVSVLVLSQPASAHAGEQLTQKTGIHVHWGAAFRVDPDADDGIGVSFEDFSEKKYVRKNTDMVVVYVDVSPPADLGNLASTAGIDIAANGYLQVTDASGSSIETSRMGIYAAGCGSGPKNIRDSVADARAAGDAALTTLNPLLLDSVTDEPGQESTPAPDEELRAQIEQLLHALISQPGS